MSDNKTYRIKATVGQDSMLNVNLNQDYKTFEILSLKINSDNLYKFHTSHYGCVAGRVLANGNFGIPNAKISIFIKATEEDLSDAILSYLYPYKNTRIKNEDGVRYNLLPDEQLSDCHRNVGTFPNKRLVLDDDNVFEVYDKYYKYTTRTNNSGDYMIFGVPVGEQTIHVDIDLSDIGILSQRPRDMIYKGYSATQFENANMFKKSTDLDTLTQIISQNSNVYVYPFWGETSEGDVAITRKDIEIQYVFEPTCVFMGSMITDEKSNAISKRCVPSERMGKMDRLTTGSGTIEMIRKKPDGSVEELVVQGNQLIDGNGTWCYQIPMNLDYVCTDEYGNIVPTDDPKKGIPTRTRVRFRMSFTEFENGTQYSHAAKTLVPNNPKEEKDLDYAFGSNTLDDEFATKSFRDLFLNKVYSVKSYIPRFQQGSYQRNKRFSGIKEINVNGSNNPMPYNNMRVDISFMFMLQCAIFHILLKLVTFFNKILGILYSISETYSSFDFDLGKEMKKNNTPCVYLGDGYCPDLKGWYFAPGCNKEGLYNSTFRRISEFKDDSSDGESIEKENGEDEKVCLTRNIQYFIQCTEINMAMEYDVIQFDFYNDWINGVIYSPRWNADMRKKRSYLFGLIRVSPRLNACSEENFSSSRRLVQQCAMQYSFAETTSSYTINSTSNGCADNNKQRCHKRGGRKWVSVFGSSRGGIVHKEPTSTNANAYYYKPCEWRNEKIYPFFLTDIILLGSLNENDEQGIPQTFTKLLPSTYQLPDALASTNIGAEGFLYGYSGGGALCNKSIKDEGVTIHEVEGDFSGLVKWSLNGEDYEANPYDDPKPITEAAGIDWGFSGPEQGKNNYNNLYFPGGHFLGISCTWSEVNIKSCVNLSRICELGSTISHRKSFIVKKGTDSYRYIDSIPTGLISGDELLDYAGKNEFATLNYNGLTTKRNADNGLLEYDFKTIYPINFNGELKEKVLAEGNTSYKKNLVDGSFIRTIEELSTDYYRFRMGFEGSESKREQKTHFLIVNNEKVSMPVYRNSFYFYFGISNGNTALDRLNKEFFAECPKLNKREPEVTITAEDGEPCNTENERSKGTIYISTKYVDSPRARINGGVYNNLDFSLAAQTETLEIYSDIAYDVMVYGDNITAVEKTITIGTKVSPELNDIIYNVADFAEGVVYDLNEFANDCDTAITGYVEIVLPTSVDIPAVMIVNRNKYHFLKGDYNTYGKPITVLADEIEYGNIPGDLAKCYLWEGNASYDVYVKIKCIDSETSAETISSWILCNSFTVEMPEVTDAIFDGNSEATYRRVLLPMFKTNPDYAQNVNKVFEYSNISESIRNSFKHAIFFRESKYYPDSTGSIDVECTGPVNITQKVRSEIDELSYNSNLTTLKSRSFERREDLSVLKNFYLPCELMPTQKEYNALWDLGTNDYAYMREHYGWGFNRSGDLAKYFKEKVPNQYYSGYEVYHDESKAVNKKVPYEISINGKRYEMKITPPYIPFFIKALFVIDDKFNNDSETAMGVGTYASLAIVNGIKPNGAYHSVKINNENVTSSVTYEHIGYTVLDLLFKARYEESLSIEDMYPTDVIESARISKNGTGEYRVEVVEEEGRNSFALSKIIRFIGDKDESGNYFDYRSNSAMKYYVFKKTSHNCNGLKPRAYFTRNNDKKLVSNKRKLFLVKQGNAVEISSPFFPKWDLGVEGGGQGGYFINKGTEYDEAMAWPKFKKVGNSYTEMMWSTWYFLYLNYYESSSNIVMLTEEDLGKELNYSDSYRVVGIYDEYYNRHPEENGIYGGDPLGSAITAVKFYSISNFNKYRRDMGMINE